ncbi:phosphatases II [Exidia glandulosa HHB12029]|uniref:protein-serine/threonine phosphatase n=1 Tax=Exidia glandulosa HHB12029 TaxID=1314781 RepID=A0A165G8A5_EXIGL|nr:phosphatases II [Exidia glandulosa HHB12029]
MVLVRAINNYGKDTPAGLYPEAMNEIVPGLFLGSWDAARDTDALRAAGITHVLTLMRELALYKLDNLAAPDCPLTTLHLPIIDGAAFKLLPYVPRCIEFIDAALSGGGKVLVHCFQGVSRSASVVAAYLMAKRGIARDEALELVRAARPAIQPNLGFMKQLDEFHKANYVVVIAPVAVSTTADVNADVDVAEYVPLAGTGRVKALAAAYRQTAVDRP